MAQTGTIAPRAAYPAFDVQLPTLWRRVAATGKLLERASSALRPRRQPGPDAPAGADRLQARLRVIRSYSQFVRRHPDMPLAHRNRCLDSVLSECQDLDQALSELLGLAEAPGEGGQA